MSKLKNYIPLNRRFFDHKLWQKPRVFSEAEAWLWLIQEARFDGTDTERYIAGKYVRVSYGEVPISIRFLSSKWLWGEKKVRIFLKNLKKDGSITIRNEQGNSILKLNNYEKWNSNDTPKGTLSDIDIELMLKELHELRAQQGHTKGHTRGTPGAHRGHKTEESNKGKKEKKLNICFDDFWNAYDKKVGNKEKLSKKWEKLTNAERTEAMEYIPKYKMAQPEKEFRKNPETFLNNKSWNDEIIPSSEVKISRIGQKMPVTDDYLKKLDW